MQKILAVIGGGAAGFFTAINAAEENKNLEVHIFEKSSSCLQKVKISGGGRCNVTNSCSDPQALIQFYPRGKKELLGPFYFFNPEHTMKWFSDRGIALKQENDGRIFPITNSSETIVNCFMQEVKKKNITIHLNHGIETIEKTSDNKWRLIFFDKKQFLADVLLIAAGSSNSIWKLLKNMNHTIVPPVPSLFTFKISDKRIKELPGLSVQNVKCKIESLLYQSEGALMITHLGLSGPAILKLSAFAARELSECNYNFKLKINFIPRYEFQDCFDHLKQIKMNQPKKSVQATTLFNLPSRLYKSLSISAEISDHCTWAEITKQEMHQLAKQLTESIFHVSGKNNFKEEFVTCGGVDLKEVDFKTMQSKIHEELYFAGEVLNIDALTGGFNFQAAWTTAYIAAQHIKEIS